MMHPREYLSFNAMDLWEKNPDRFMDVYLWEKKQRINRSMAKGSQAADGLETEEETGDPLLDLVIEMVPKYEYRDRKFQGILKGPKFNVPILIKPDSATANLSGIIEYKTGIERWSKKKVDELDQITFYAMGAFIIAGKIPRELDLIHIETEREKDEDGNDIENGKINVTGQFYRHRTSRTMTDILKMMVRARKAWKEIGERYQAELV